MGSHGSSSVCMPSRRLEQPIVAVAEDLACVDMVDGRLIENLHVDDARRVLAWADAIAERATHRLTLRRQAHGETDRESRGRYWRSSGHRRGHSALALSFGRQKRTCGCRSKIWRRRGPLLLRDAGHRRLSQDGQRRVIPCRLRRRKRLSGVCWRSGSPRVATGCIGRLRAVAISLPFRGVIRGDSAIFGGDESEA